MKILTKYVAIYIIFHWGYNYNMGQSKGIYLNKYFVWSYKIRTKLELMRQYNYIDAFLFSTEVRREDR